MILSIFNFIFYFAIAGVGFSIARGFKYFIKTRDLQGFFLLQTQNLIIIPICIFFIITVDKKRPFLQEVNLVLFFCVSFLIPVTMACSRKVVVNLGRTYLENGKALWKSILSILQYQDGIIYEPASTLKEYPIILAAKKMLEKSIIASPYSSQDTMKSKVNKALAYRELGLVNRLVNDFEEAEDHYLTSSEILDSLGSLLGGINSFNPHVLDPHRETVFKLVLDTYRGTIFRLGELNHARGKQNLAAQYYRQKLRLDEILNHDEPEAEQATRRLLSQVENTTEQVISEAVMLGSSGNFAACEKLITDKLDELPSLDNCTQEEAQGRFHLMLLLSESLRKGKSDPQKELDLLNECALISERSPFPLPPTGPDTRVNFTYMMQMSRAIAAMKLDRYSLAEEALTAALRAARDPDIKCKCLAYRVEAILNQDNPSKYNCAWSSVEEFDSLAVDNNIPSLLKAQLETGRAILCVYRQDIDGARSACVLAHQLDPNERTSRLSRILQRENISVDEIRNEVQSLVMAKTHSDTKPLTPLEDVIDSDTMKDIFENET